MTYTRKILTIQWQANSGRMHVRRVDIGHVTETANLSALAVLNIGMRGDVISFTATAA